MFAHVEDSTSPSTDAPKCYWIGRPFSPRRVPRCFTSSDKYWLMPALRLCHAARPAAWCKHVMLRISSAAAALSWNHHCKAHTAPLDILSNTASLPCTHQKIFPKKILHDGTKDSIPVCRGVQYVVILSPPRTTVFSSIMSSYFLSLPFQVKG